MPHGGAAAGKKRDRDGRNVLNEDSGDASGGGGGGGGGSNSTNNFRNVSACNRCRNRKNRCDQKLPRCTNCARVGAQCVGFDPVSKREIPRSYVYYLETRVHNLEAILRSHDIPCPPAREDFAISDVIKPGINVPFPVLQDEGGGGRARGASSPRSHTSGSQSVLDPALTSHDHSEQLQADHRRANNHVATFRSVHDAKSSSLVSGISFARIVSAAVKRTVNHTPLSSERGGGARTPRHLSTDSTVAGGDSFFGLYSKPNIASASFPDKELGTRLVELYFEYANPQIPVLHRGEYMELFERVYSAEPNCRTARELYMLNIVFAIGSGIIMDSSSVQPASPIENVDGSSKRQRLHSEQYQPEEYHASAIVHLESFLESSPTSEGVAGGYEELQAVLLLASLALLRPVAPGLWYIIGVAVRLSIDLGLHLEDNNEELDTRATHPDVGPVSDKKLGRKQWTRDMQRRLWWCTFNLDRLVSSCVGRPISVNEAVVTTQFPSLLDDKFITPKGFLKSPLDIELPSYKLVSRHYIRLRLLQSEILQVLQFRQADHARRLTAGRADNHVFSDLDSPFLQRFNSFREWRADIDIRLGEWRESAPQQVDTGVAFTPLFLELNYWQAIIMLYRQSLSVPEPLASELSPAMGEDVPNPDLINMEIEEDKQMVFLKVAQAGQTVLKIYRQLHRLKLVNYTFLATHHLFMSGISFLYAIWQSTLVRDQLTIDDVEFTVFVATSVLSDLIEKCPPAETCRDAFVRMSKATISMVVRTTGFGNASILATQRLGGQPPDGHFDHQHPMDVAPIPIATSAPRRRHLPQFDMNLKDLFSDEELASQPISYSSKLPPPPPTMIHAATQHHHHHHQHIKSQPLSPQYTNVSRAHIEAMHSSDRLSDNADVLSSSVTNQPTVNPGFDGGETPSSSSYPPLTQQQLDENNAAAAAAWSDLDFLRDFPMADPNGASGGGIWGGGVGTPSDMDLGSNSGVSGATAGFDSSGAWEANSELLDTYFFGAGGNGF